MQQMVGYKIAIMTCIANCHFVILPTIIGYVSPDGLIHMRPLAITKYWPLGARATHFQGRKNTQWKEWQWQKGWGWGGRMNENDQEEEITLEEWLKNGESGTFRRRVKREKGEKGEKGVEGSGKRDRRKSLSLHQTAQLPSTIEGVLGSIKG